MRNSKELVTDSKFRAPFLDSVVSGLVTMPQIEAGQITVTARLRPAIKLSKSSLSFSVDSQESTILVSRSNEEPLSLQFNHAFGPEASQAHVYRRSFHHLSDCIFKG